VRALPNGGMTGGLRVSMFLTSAAVDLVRKRAIETTQVNPLEPLKGAHRRLLASRRYLVGLHALCEVARLCARGSHRRCHHYRFERDARTDQGGRRDALFLNRAMLA